MSWTDEEIDKLFQDSAEGMSFEYKDEYWQEMDAMLPQRRRGLDAVWFITAILFLGIFGTAGVVGEFSQDDNSLAQHTGNGTNTTATDNKSTASAQVFSENVRSLDLDGQAKLLNKNAFVFEFNPEDFVLPGFDYPHYQMPSYGEPYPINIFPVDPNVGMMPHVEQVANLSLSDNSDVDELPVRELDAPQADLAKTYFDPIRKAPTKAGLYLELNGGLSQSLVSPSDRMSNSFGGGLGLQFHSGNWQFNVGTNFIVSNHSDIELNRKGKFYSFGSTDVNYHLDYTKIYTVETNFSVGYNLGKHTIVAGVRPSWIVGTQLTEMHIEDGVEVSRGTLNGDIEGLEVFGLKPMIGYAYHFAPQWTVGMNLGVQLRQPLNEEYIDKQNNLFPIDGQLYLRRTISFRK